MTTITLPPCTHPELWGAINILNQLCFIGYGLDVEIDYNYKYGFVVMVKTKIGGWFALANDKNKLSAINAAIEYVNRILSIDHPLNSDNKSGNQYKTDTNIALVRRQLHDMACNEIDPEIRRHLFDALYTVSTLVGEMEKANTLTKEFAKGDTKKPKEKPPIHKRYKGRLIKIEGQCHK